MTTTLTATFDGKVLIPAEPIDLPRGTVVRLRVEVPEQASDGGGSALEKIGRLAVNGGLPRDYARQHEHYVKGAPRR